MKTTMTAKGMNISPAIENRVLRKTQTMSKYLRADTEMFVRMRKEKNQRIVEITVPINGVLLRAEAASEDNLFMSIDRALAKLEKQILRHRTRLDKRLREGLTADTQPEFIEDLGAGDQEAREVVRSKTYTVRPMSQEDAVMQMELLGHSFFVYVDLDTNQTHVLYLRRDGNLGLLVPEA
ncbi:MAG TPA: ribosome-associated translation inhibitor RaiA [Clostridia bacterium]|jgi:putative sigma-54 modulation protein|nr:ribosome-associated translation inhibitor RaiA [Clostridia bacterium]HPA60997.1 ribosome-associated translation inhibitor RaiA [Clostridia bacterium]HPY44111.1 ribosome-associated translation inhibitor RaiA [Clostridia bacterium]HQA97683.1 ribosome-associated translation inhibitor RaiA [Clostridia bacterium]HQO56149.1 ribosome-associated translation inhibitor RaiA [Clostridia bacterium]